MSKDTWSDFTKVAANEKQIINLEKTVVPNPDALVNSIWKVKYTIGEEATIKFKADNKLEYNEPNYPKERTYLISGAGIIFSSSTLHFIGMKAYYIIQNNSIKGFAIFEDRPNIYSSCTGTKQ